MPFFLLVPAYFPKHSFSFLPPGPLCPLLLSAHCSFLPFLLSSSAPLYPCSFLPSAPLCPCFFRPQHFSAPCYLLSLLLSAPCSFLSTSPFCLLLLSAPTLCCGYLLDAVDLLQGAEIGFMLPPLELVSHQSLGSWSDSLDPRIRQIYLA